MAQTKVKLISDGVIVQGNLHSSHGITTAHIAEGTSSDSGLYYTNARVDSRIAAASTSDLSEGTNLYYTDARADARVALIVDSSPATLNTLNELAAALGDDPNFAATTATSIGLKAPLASPSFTGIITANSSSSGDYVRLYGSSGTGKWDIYGNGANLRISDNESAGILAVDTGATFAGNISLSANKHILIGADSGDAFNSDSAIRIQDTGNAYVQIKTGTGNQGGVLIGDNDDDYVGGFIYSNSSNTLTFQQNNAAALTISGSGNATFAGNVGVAGKPPAYGLTLAQGTAVGSKIAWTDSTPNFAASIYANSSTDKLTFATKNSSNVETTALEIDISQNATFAGDVFAPRFDVGTTNTSIIQETNRMKFTNAIANDAGGFDFYTRNSGSTYINALQILGTGNATFSGGVTGTIARFDTLNNNANSANIIYRSGTDTIVGGGSPPNKIYIQDSGNVGIGTTLPTTALTIRKAIASQTYGEQASMIEFKSYFPAYDVETVKSAIYSGVSAVTGLQTTRGFMSFWTADYVTGGGESLTEKMRIESNGNVGIGTDAPGRELTVEGGGNVYIKIQSRTDNDSTALELQNTQHLWTIANDDTNNDALEFRSGGVGTPMVIEKGGNVGIGTTGPDNILHISDAGATTLVRVGNNGAYDAGIYFNTSTDWTIGTDTSNSNAFTIGNSSSVGASPKIVIQTGGNVGIGTTTPSAKLDARGAIMTGSAAEDGNFSSTTATGRSVCESGSLQITQGWIGSGTNGDTVVFRYNATSWKSWGLEWNFMSTNGMSSGFTGGYNNNSTGHSKVINNNAHGITVSFSNSSQNNIITFTSTTGFGTHPMASFKYYQSGGDGRPYPSKASITMNS